MEEAERMPSNILFNPSYLPSVASCAWRWAPEILQIVDALWETGLPAEQAEAAAPVMSRWETDKDHYGLPLAKVIARLRQGCSPGVTSVDMGTGTEP